MADALPKKLRDYQARVLERRQTSCIDFPAHVHLETMAKCNAACHFCPYPTIDRQGTVMDDTLIEKIIDDLTDIPQSHAFMVSPFKVNEPFLDKRLFDVLDLITEKLPQAQVTLTSNASPITESKVEKLAAYKNIGYLWISFNDHRETQYEQAMQLPYGRTIKRLQMLHRAKAEGRLPLKVVLSRVGDSSADDRDFGLWVREHFPLFEPSLFMRGNWLGQTDIGQAPPQAVGCSRWFDLSITATGVVAHCCMDGNADFPIGDARHEHVLDIYNKPDYRRLRETLTTRFEAEPCSSCGFL